MKDTILRSQIVAEVRAAMQVVMEEAQEKWVTGAELTKQFSFFTPYFLKHYGQMIPREQVRYQDENGNWHPTGYGYPLHKIQRMVREGAFRWVENKEKQQ